MNLSNDTYDALLKDWWESNDPRYIKEIRFNGFGGTQNQIINYVAHVYEDETTESAILVENCQTSKAEFLIFIAETL